VRHRGRLYKQSRILDYNHEPNAFYQSMVRPSTKDLMNQIRQSMIEEHDIELKPNTAIRFDSIASINRRVQDAVHEAMETQNASVNRTPLAVAINKQMEKTQKQKLITDYEPLVGGKIWHDLDNVSQELQRFKLERPKDAPVYDKADEDAAYDNMMKAYNEMEFVKAAERHRFDVNWYSSRLLFGNPCCSNLKELNMGVQRGRKGSFANRMDWYKVMYSTGHAARFAEHGDVQDLIKHKVEMAMSDLESPATETDGEAFGRYYKELVAPDPVVGQKVLRRTGYDNFDYIKGMWMPNKDEDKFIYAPVAHITISPDKAELHVIYEIRPDSGIPIKQVIGYLQSMERMMKEDGE